ncbi:MAG: 30S ribosome-binding factor RbfA [Lachnospiraceae bacterium]|nr:30S ribosome-binding factor RbfA [Lachnospiraceae bacterium]
MRKSSVKNNRVNEEVMRELAEIIRKEIKDPRMATLVSVVSCEVAPDLKTAKAYISAMGGENPEEGTLAALNSAKGYIKKLLAKRVNLRNTPDITFIMDSSIAYGVDMISKIESVIAKDNEKKED